MRNYIQEFKNQWCEVNEECEAMIVEGGLIYRSWAVFENGAEKDAVKPFGMVFVPMSKVQIEAWLKEDFTNG